MATTSIWATVASHSDLLAKRSMVVRRFGIPFVVSIGADASLYAYVAICPHAWVRMPRMKLRAGCLACPLHGATFEQATGAVRDSRGKRIRRRLKPVPIEVRDGAVRLAIGLDCIAFVIASNSRRFLREAAHLRKKLYAKREGT
jgi:nitrite reductase/ring-hydroxylating ferredoxin subunit